MKLGMIGAIIVISAWNASQAAEQTTTEPADASGASSAVSPASGGSAEAKMNSKKDEPKKDEAKKSEETKQTPNPAVSGAASPGLVAPMPKKRRLLKGSKKVPKSTKSLINEPVGPAGPPPGDSASPYINRGTRGTGTGSAGDAGPTGPSSGPSGGPLGR